MGLGIYGICVLNIRDCYAMVCLVTCLRVSLFVAVVRARLLYDVLGVRRDASQEEIKRVYKKLARQWHPDKNKSPRASEKFMEINGAYEILSNKRKRFLYDYFGETALHRSQRSNFRATKKRPGFEPEPDFEPESSSWTLSYMVLFVAFLVMAASYFLQTNTPVSKQKSFGVVGDIVPQLRSTKMIIDPPVGKICVVLLVTQKKKLTNTVQAFHQAIGSNQKDTHLCFCWLAVYENSKWLSMMQTAMDGPSSEVKAFGNGSILAINGKKLYFSVLAGVHLYSTDQRSSSAFEDTFQLNADASEESLIDSYCSDVCSWLDRLLDGTLRRYHVDQWPDIEECN